MFFEVPSLTYHSSITIRFFTYGGGLRPMAETPVRWVLRHFCTKVLANMLESVA